MKENGAGSPYSHVGAAASGMPAWHNESDWTAWAYLKVRMALKGSHRLFEYHPGDAPVHYWVHRYVPEENPGAKPVGYEPMWEDDLLVDYIVMNIRYAVPPFDQLLLSAQFELFPLPDSHFWVVDYLSVRNEMDSSCLDFRKLWPTDRLRHSIALLYSLHHSYFMDIPLYGEWDDPDILPEGRGYSGIAHCVDHYGEEIFFFGRHDDDEAYDFAERPISVPQPSAQPSYLAQIITFLAQTRQIPIESRMLRELGGKSDIASLIDVLTPYVETAVDHFERGMSPHYDAWRVARFGR